ncbi:energy-coupling factor transporter transmembrane component T family protein [Actinopolymorpha alba]|uniref:energy-coupling factor transporter transmembrane component T family protein n=1 Tax=Actinopolymorpha alba TaxID=533267 RepID=UPI0003670B4F|nr:energy-coupling factor transporter transmembrane component T [Actinopolymorpha alba]
MSIVAEPLVDNPRAPVARLNPVTKLAAAFVVIVGLLLTGDAVTPAIVLGAELLAIAAAGIRWRVFVRRLWLLFVTVGGLGVSTLLFTDQRSGADVLDAGPVHVTTGSLLAATAVILRVFAIALPGIVALASTDPTEFADALVQHLRTPPRFTFGALAAFRLLPVLGDEWRTLMLARRARGIDAGRSPVRRARLFASGVFALLVGAIRRGVRLAAAMESRGFTQRPDRTLARPQRLRAADGLFVAGTAAVVVGATALSVVLGTWRFLFW